MAANTIAILDYFNKINSIPRCSTNEVQLTHWLRNWAQTRRFRDRVDDTGNLVIYVPATHGYEGRPPVVLQGHMDMVCEKTPRSAHNFDKDPIISRIDGEWLITEGTTLGADNGIAIALALSLTDDDHLSHPPLELLFTVDEESGLNGAKMLDPRLLSGRRLLNLDSEEEGVFTIGCAGGQDLEMEIDIETLPLSSHQWIGHRLIVGGLRGGHSGIDIHKPRANANKILARLLEALKKEFYFRLVDIKGGSRHNAIPRDAEAVIAVEPIDRVMLQNAMGVAETAIQAEYGPTEPDLVISLKPTDIQKTTALSKADTDRVINVLLALPHGVAGTSQDFLGPVETSCNLATVTCADQHVTILSSQRSSVMSRLEEINQRVSAVARLAGAGIRSTTGYPPWTPDPDSALLSLSRNVYRTLFDQEPIVQVIHAGLECAVIGNKYKGMEMISFGPTIQNAHSPHERLHLPSIERVQAFLVALLEAHR